MLLVEKQTTKVARSSRSQCLGGCKRLYSQLVLSRNAVNLTEIGPDIRVIVASLDRGEEHPDRFFIFCLRRQGGTDVRKIDGFARMQRRGPAVVPQSAVEVAAAFQQQTKHVMRLVQLR